LRLATVITDSGLRLHVRGASGYVDVATASGDERLADISSVLGAGEDVLDKVRAAAQLDGRDLTPAEFAATVPNPPRILCLGLNYADHAAEGGRPMPTWPEVFVRGAASVVAPFGEVTIPALSTRFDYEGELGIVIGRGGRYIAAKDALGAIAGFLVVMDGSARDWQGAATQFTAGKNFDGTMPIGPELVSPDEVDVSDLQLTTTLNGEVMQSASTATMIFDVPRAIEHLSSFTTLAPGDVIATGTPSGVGFARKPPVFLKPGDLLEVEIEGIGRIANRMVAEDRDMSAWAWHPPRPERPTM
jgi:acylpyruvate hydrolase